MGGMQVTSSKRALRSKTDNLNPVIISNALNSTLNRIADVMEKSLDVTAAAIPNPVTAPAPTSSVAPSSITPSTGLMPSQPPNPTSNLSISEILDEAIRITTADNTSLTEDELLAASMFFTSASDDAVRAARTFIALGNNSVVQHRFLLRQLTTAALLPGRGKDKDNDGNSMVY